MLEHLPESRVLGKNADILVKEREVAEDVEHLKDTLQVVSLVHVQDIVVHELVDILWLQCSPPLEKRLSERKKLVQQSWNHVQRKLVPLERQRDKPAECPVDLVGEL